MESRADAARNSPHQAERLLGYGNGTALLDFGIFVLFSKARVRAPRQGRWDSGGHHGYWLDLRVQVWWPTETGDEVVWLGGA